MIIKNDYLNRKENYLEEERKGLDKAIQNLDKRFKNNEIERDQFFKDLKIFKERGDDLKKRMEKNSR